MRFEKECVKKKVTKGNGEYLQLRKLLLREFLVHAVTCGKEVNMIRKFRQCKNTKERLEMLANTGIADWAEGELNTVMEIFGMKVPEGASKEDKWELIMLSLTSKEAADIEALGHKVFNDAKEVKEFAEEELEHLSDLSAYIKVCGENIAQE